MVELSGVPSVGGGMEMGSILWVNKIRGSNTLNKILFKVLLCFLYYWCTVMALKVLNRGIISKQK